MRTADCHPERKHYCKGMCIKCYSQQQGKKYYSRNSEKVKISSREWSLANKERVKANTREYYLLNKDRAKERSTKWNKDNKARHNEITRSWAARNRASIRTADRLRRATDDSFRIKKNLQRGMCSAVNGRLKSGGTATLLGCSIPSFMEYLQGKFTEGMAWNNYGTWHIDHIRPCASFNLLDPEEQKRCFHFTNLQPLWALDNFMKGARLLENAS